MTTIEDPDREVRQLLERAAGIKLAALGFACPAPGHLTAVGTAFSRITADSAAPGPDRTPFAAAEAAWSVADEAEIALEYTRLFLGNAPCAPHETSYGDARRIAGHGVELADIAGFYAAFGFALSTVNPDLPDHLCAELEFYSLLLVKQAYAELAGETQGAEITAQAAKSFLEHHLGRWVGAFAEALGEHRAAPAYLALGRFLATLIRAECERQGVTPTPLSGRLPAGASGQEAFTCPRGEASVS